ncbi:hypothetical protein ACRALDRAFT_2031492 [Sodiomyces alcalophilus JCM 7366]|uniref:uncharacterized protein n=1 Tax=Sodiomyces alcalophilus JCM 7366 TaxID=591952 RepID=UPI0039B6C7EA
MRKCRSRTVHKTRTRTSARRWSMLQFCRQPAQSVDAIIENLSLPILSFPVIRIGRVRVFQLGQPDILTGFRAVPQLPRRPTVKPAESITPAENDGQKKSKRNPADHPPCCTHAREGPVDSDEFDEDLCFEEAKTLVMGIAQTTVIYRR